MNIIIGDNHDLESYYYINSVLTQLTKYKMLDFLLEENAFDFELYTSRKIQEKIDTKEGMVGDMLYQLGIDWKLPIIGIDLPIDEPWEKNLKTSFEKRETRMLTVIRKYNISNSCLTIVGDTHLRSGRVSKLGGISLHSSFVGKKDTFIVRADKREVDVGELPKGTLSRDEFFRMIMSKEFILKYKRNVVSRRFTP